MALATLTFSAPINVSCQVGDTAYYVATTTSGGFSVDDSAIVMIGDIVQIQNPTTTTPVITARTTLGYTELNGLTGKFILFSKDNKANLNSPVGYYASLKMVNADRTNPAELFSVAAEVFNSSK
tara:strand:- start:1391 stop:1762 length:372 start_codon:yes stop_codon:yes gene_type:complete